MSRDFQAKQLRTSKIIASGGIGQLGEGSAFGNTPARHLGLMIYSGSVAGDYDGSVGSIMLDDVGHDVYFFISGSKTPSKGYQTKEDLAAAGYPYDPAVVLFGGDVVVSGTLYAERMIAEVDSTVDGDFYITGTLFLDGDNATDAVLQMHKDASDYFSITTTTNGATTLATVDAAATAAHLTLDADGDIIIDAAGGDVFFKESGTTFASISEDGDDAYFNFGTTAGSSGYGFQDDAGTLKWKNTGGSWAIFGAVNALNDLSDVTYSSGDLTITSLDTIVAGALTIDSSGDIALSADGGNVTMDDGTTTVFDFDTDNVVLKIMDDADTGDYFSIAVGAAGATTITTVDDDAQAADLSFVVDGEIVLDAGSGGISLKGGGETRGAIQLYSQDVTLRSTISNKDIKFIGNDGGHTDTILGYFDVSVGGRFYAHSLYVTGTDGKSTLITGNQIAATSDLELIGTSIELDSAGDIVIDTGGADIFLKDDAADFGQFSNSGGTFIISGSAAADNTDIIFMVGHDSVSTEIVRLDGSQNAFTVNDGSTLKVGTQNNFMWGSAGHGLNITGSYFNVMTTAGDVTIGSVADIQFQTVGGNIEFFDNMVKQLTIDMDSTANEQIIKLEVNSDDLVFKQFDGNEVIRIADDRKLYFYDKGGEHISSDGTALTIAAGEDINLTATTDINIPVNVGLTFGNDGEKIEGNGSGLTIDGGLITLDSEGSIFFDAGDGTLTFYDAGSSFLRLQNESAGPTFFVQQNDEDIIFKGYTSSTYAEVTRIDSSASSLLMASGKKIEFGGTASSISGDGTDVTLTSTGNVNIATSVNEANAIYLHADGGTSETIKIHADRSEATAEDAAAIQLTSDLGGIGFTAHGGTIGVQGNGTGGNPAFRFTSDASSMYIDIKGEFHVDAGLYSGAAGWNLFGTAASSLNTTAGAITIDGETGVTIKENGQAIITVDDDRDVTIGLNNGSYGDPDVTLSGYTKVGPGFAASGGVIFNEDSDDVDFRVEGNNSSHALVVDGGTDSIIMGTAGNYNNIPVATLHIRQDQSTAPDGKNSSILIEHQNSTLSSSIIFGEYSTSANTTTVLSEIISDTDHNLVLSASKSNTDIIFKVNEGGSEGEVARFDGSAGTLLMAGTKGIQFGSAAAYIHHDGTDLKIADDADINLVAGVDILLDAAGDINLDAGGSNINFQEGGTTFASVNEDGDDAYFNFGTTAGTSGYGIQDDAGTLKWKNTGGSWATFGSGGSGAVSAVANGANDRVATFSSSDALNGEATLTFDSDSTLTVTNATNSAIPGIKIDRNYTGTTTVGNLTTDASGMLIDYDVTGIVASGQTAVHDALAINYNQDAPTHVGNVFATGADIRMTGGTSGVQSMKGVAIVLAGADTNTGIDITVPNDGTHIIARSPDNVLDHFKLSVGAAGATTLSTSDADATAAHLTLDVDGNVTIDADAGTIAFADGGASLGTITSAGWTGDVVGDVTGNADTATKIASITNSNIVQLTSSQTLTNKTLTSPDIDTPDIDGGTIDGVTLGGTLAGTPTFSGVGTHQAHDIFETGITIKNADASAGYINFYEQSSNGTNVCTFRGKSSMGNITITLPGDTGTVVLEDNTVTLSNKTIDGATMTGTTTFSDGNITNVGSIALDTITNDGADVTIDSSGDITLDTDSGTWLYKDNGVEIFQFANGNSDVILAAAVEDKDIKFVGNVGGNTAVSLGYFDTSAGGTFYSHSLVVTGTNGVTTTLTGNELDVSSGNLTLDVAGDINLDAAGSNINFQEAGTTFASINEDGDDAYLNFGTTAGTGGYGFVDDAGVMKWKNSGGSWAIFGGGGGSSALDDLSDVSYSGGDLTITSLDTIIAGALTIDSSGDITLDADGGNIIFKDGGTEVSRRKMGTATHSMSNNNTSTSTIDTFSVTDFMMAKYIISGKPTNTNDRFAVELLVTADIASNSNAPIVAETRVNSNYDAKAASGDYMSSANLPITVTKSGTTVTVVLKSTTVFYANTSDGSNDGEIAVSFERTTIS